MFNGLWSCDCGKWVEATGGYWKSLEFSGVYCNTTAARSSILTAPEGVATMFQCIRWNSSSDGVDWARHGNHRVTGVVPFWAAQELEPQTTCGCSGFSE
jgi:hypothetical protein